MVKTEQGKKFVVVDEYRRRGPGGTFITVHAHARSTPCAANGAPAGRAAKGRRAPAHRPMHAA